MKTKFLVFAVLALVLVLSACNLPAAPTASAIDLTAAAMPAQFAAQTAIGSTPIVGTSIPVYEIGGSGFPVSILTPTAAPIDCPISNQLVWIETLWTKEGGFLMSMKVTPGAGCNGKPVSFKVFNNDNPTSCVSDEGIMMYYNFYLVCQLPDLKFSADRKITILIRGENKYEIVEGKMEVGPLIFH